MVLSHSCYYNSPGRHIQKGQTSAFEDNNEAEPRVLTQELNGPPVRLLAPVCSPLYLFAEKQSVC